MRRLSLASARREGYGLVRTRGGRRPAGVPRGGASTSGYYRGESSGGGFRVEPRGAQRPLDSTTGSESTDDDPPRDDIDQYIDYTGGRRGGRR